MDAHIREQEVETFLSFVMGADPERDLEERTFHVLREFGLADFEAVSDVLVAADSTASFAVLGRDAHEQAESIEHLQRAGHEIVFHGHRHVSFGSLSYEIAHENLAMGLDALEDATGIEPAGFFAPFKTVSTETLDAAAELGFDWVLGRTDGDVPDGIDLVESVYPHDVVVLKEGNSPAETFERFRDVATDGTLFLFHPNLLEFHDASEDFESWIRDVRPVTIESMLQDGGVGVVLDCLRPVQIE